MTNFIFRFQSVRPPQRATQDANVPDAIQVYRPTAGDSNVRKDLLKARDAQNPRAQVTQIASKFITAKEKTFVSNLADLPIPLKQFDTLLNRQKGQITLSSLTNAVKQTFGKTPTELLKTAEFTTSRQRVSDSLVAATIVRSGTVAARPQLVRAMRLLGLIEALGEGRLKQGDIDGVLHGRVLLPSDLFPLPSAPSPTDDQLRKEFEDAKKEIEKRVSDAAVLVQQLEQLETALTEVNQGFSTDIVETRRKFEQAKITTSIGDNIGGAGLTSGARAAAAPTDKDTVVFSDSPQTQSFVLSKATTERLSSASKTVLKGLGASDDFIDVPKVSGAIEKEIARVASKLYVAERGRRRVRIGGISVSADIFDAPAVMAPPDSLIPGPCAPVLPEPPLLSSVTVPSGAGTPRPVGISDLMVVEQKIMRYEAGEIAHIENILKGEANERKHRRTTTTEETTIFEVERTQETERDLQTSERFELQLEAAQVISEDTSKEAGITATAKYGPSLEVTANADFAIENSKEDSKRSSTTYARDVTDRAVSRTQERVRQQRTLRTVEEVEEITTHTFDNRTGEGHVIGIYRWVDKVYQAQVINYGRRMLFEFIVPEPAAFYRHALTVLPDENKTLEEPVAPGYCVPGKGNFLPLAPKDLNAGNYLFWVGQYGVESVDTPPPLYQVLGTAIAQPNVAESKDAQAKTELQVPSGYVAKSAWITKEAMFKTGAQAQIRVLIGRKRAENNLTPLDDETGVVPLSIAVINALAYVVNVEVLCERTQEHYDKWKIATFNAIMTKYNELKGQYEEQSATAEVVTRSSIQGRNPLLNREIEKTELKKGAISLLTGQHFDLFDAMRKSVGPHRYPQMDLTEAEAEGRYIQFFEQAFEWTHIMYVFYPYFWGRKEDWPALLLMDDSDPLFARFLQAGSARVQVPVRPGYEEAILHFVESGGELWDGGDPPHVDDELYMSLVDEIKEQQGNDVFKSGGTLAVTKGSADVTGTGTGFAEGEVDRRIMIANDEYRIAAVASATRLTLTEPYRGESSERTAYTIGSKLVGEPWEVRVPTTLVYLQQGPELPNFD